MASQVSTENVPFGWHVEKLCDVLLLELRANALTLRITAPTIADCRRILHTAQVMQPNTAQRARELYALGRLEVWMRGMIRERV
jgi:hypothetical protein